MNGLCGAIYYKRNEKQDCCYLWEHLLGPQDVERLLDDESTKTKLFLPERFDGKDFLTRQQVSAGPFGLDAPNARRFYTLLIVVSGRGHNHRPRPQSD